MLEDLVTLHQNSGQDPKVSMAVPYGAPLHWLHVYQQFRDRQSPVDLAQLQRNSRSTLKDFLDKNLEIAKEKQESSKAILEENKLLSERICKELTLKELKVASRWSYSSCHGSLKNFLKFCHSKQSELESLHGRTVVFTDWTGIDPHGHIMLNTRDVPEFWLSVCLIIIIIVISVETFYIYMYIAAWYFELTFYHVSQLSSVHIEP